MTKSIFHWLTGNRNHHIVMKESTDKKSYWWQIERREHGVSYDVANCPTPGFRTPEAATKNAREFLDGIGADYLEVEGTE